MFDVMNRKHAIDMQQQCGERPVLWALTRRAATGVELSMAPD